MVSAITELVSHYVLIMALIQNRVKLRGICMGIPAFCMRVSAGEPSLQLKNVWIALPSSVRCTITTSCQCMHKSSKTNFSKGECQFEVGK